METLLEKSTATLAIFTAWLFHVTQGAAGAEALNCYACGLGMVDPVIEGHVYNMDEQDTAAKMYNETCTLFETMLLEYPGSMEKWVRPCPSGVKSCFWAEGHYEGDNPRFRGCADALYNHDPGCKHELQAVTVVDNKKSVDVEVELCYCSEAKCNQERNGAANFGWTAALLMTAIPISTLHALQY